MDNVEFTQEEREIARKLINMAKKILEERESPHYSESASGILRDVPKMKEMELDELAFMLNHGTYGCHENDVYGLIKHIENYLGDA